MSSNKILFDDVHTQNKQRNLKKIFSEAASLAKSLPSGNRLDACPACDEPDFQHFGTYYGFEVEKCSKCSLLFCNPQPTSEQLNCFYNSDFKIFENEYFHDSWDTRLNIFKWRVELIDKLEVGVDLLDIGSGIGLFIEAINRFSVKDYSLSCAEMSSDSARRIRQKFPNAKVLEVDGIEIEASNSFDAITLWDCFEHLTDPKKYLNKFHLLLRNNGVILLSTPNTTSFEWIVADKMHPQILPPGHINLFNTNNIKLLLEKSGFFCESIYTPNASLDCSYIEKNIAENFISERLGKFVSHILQDQNLRHSFEEYLVKKRLGGNMVVVARKK